MNALRLRRGCAVASALALASPPAYSANAAFQTFFFQACTAATGALATRCGETQGGLGNISGDSESSLNPSQSLSHTEVTLAASATRSQESRERADALRKGGEDPPAGAVAMGPFSLLAQVRGTWFERDRDPAVDAERGFDGDGWAAELGFDYRVSPRILFGGILGYERNEYEFDGENPGVNFTPAPVAGDTKTDGYYLTLFGTFALGETGFLELSGGASWDSYDFRRNSVFQESGRQVPQTNVNTSGSADGRTTWVGLNLGADVAVGAVGMGGYAGVTYSRSQIDGYAESDLSNSGLAMSFDRRSRTSILGHAGLRASYAVSGRSGVFVPQLRAEYQYEFEDEVESVTSGLLLDGSGAQYRLAGDRLDRSGIALGFGVVGVLPGGWSLFIDCETLVGNDDTERQRATLGFRKEL